MGEGPTLFLIVSLGSIGRRHLRNLRRRMPDAEIAVLRLSGAGPVEPIEHANLILAGMGDVISFAPDAAIIASPASTHVAIACKLAEHGIHLLIEKPLACDAAAASHILDVTRKTGVTCMVGYNLRFKASLLEVRRLLGARHVGDILSVRAEVGQYLPSWRPQQDYRKGVSARAELGGGALLELSHELDYLVWLFGMPHRVQCSMGRYSQLEIDVEDLVNITLEYREPRRLVDVHLDFLQRRAVRQCRFIGSEGTMLWDAIADTIALQGMSRRDQDEVLGPFDADANNTYLAELDHFISAIANGTAVSPAVAEGLDVLKLIQAARLSAQTGKTIEMEALDNAH